ncbi:MAG: KamA family radical SAM protein, partial [Planctomycetota bacterium]
MIVKAVKEKVDKSNVTRLWDKNPEVFHILKGADSIASARRLIYVYLLNCEIALDEDFSAHPLKTEITKSAIKSTKNIISEKSERLAEFSAIGTLWALAREDYSVLPELSRGFFEDIGNLLLAVRGQANIYATISTVPRFLQLKGRKAAIERSRQLDQLYITLKSFMNRYAAGLDPEIIEKRKSNKERVLKVLNGSEKNWRDAEWHFKNVIKDVQTLGKIVNLSDEEKESIKIMVDAKIPFGVSPYYASLMDKEPSRVNDHAVRAQVIPHLTYAKFMLEHKGERDQAFDFMLEHDTSPIDLVTRRYPSICILKPYNSCPQICTYCQRNWEIDEAMAPDALASDKDIKKAL